MPGCAKPGTRAVMCSCVLTGSRRTQICAGLQRKPLPRARLICELGTAGRLQHTECVPVSLIGVTESSFGTEGHQSCLIHLLNSCSGSALSVPKERRNTGAVFSFSFQAFGHIVLRAEISPANMSAGRPSDQDKCPHSPKKFPDTPKNICAYGALQHYRLSCPRRPRNTSRALTSLLHFLACAPHPPASGARPGTSPFCAPRRCCPAPCPSCCTAAQCVGCNI